MTAAVLTVRAKVLDASIYPTTDRQRLWLVQLHVEDVIAGVLPEGGRELSILVHSPSRDFRDSEPVGQTFLITFKGLLTNPYSGAIDVARDRQA